MKNYIYSIHFKFIIIFIAVFSLSALVTYPLTLALVESKAFGNQISVIIMASITLYFIWSSLLTWLAVSFVTRPLKKLTIATQKVAKGNFNVKVDYNNSNDELGTLIQNFNLMAQELNHIEYMRKDFLSSVSHEFKTPIASIKGFAKLLRETELSQEDTHAYLQIIEDEAGRLSKLSSNILKLTNIENKAILPQPVSFGLDEQIRKTILLFTNLWEEKNLVLDVQLDKMTIVGDEELIQQIWINLIENAIKFSRPNGTVYVYLRSQGDNVVVTVADDGAGIPKEQQKHIFDQFYQADPSHSTYGNGLGLSIVKSILNRIQGSIEVDSDEGEGAAFAVTLPKVPSGFEEA